MKGVTDIIRKDSSSNRPQNGLTLSSNKTWEPDKWSNPNEISKSLLNRYFYSVLPDVHHKMSNGLSTNSEETKSHNINKYRKLSLHLNKISLKKHRSKGNIFPPIHHNMNTEHPYNHHHTYSDTHTQIRSQTDHHAKISYSTFDFPVKRNSNHNKKIYKNRKGHETYITTLDEQEKTKPQQSFNIDTHEEKVKSKTCPNTPRSSHRDQTNVPTLNHIDVKFLQDYHKQKSAKSVTSNNKADSHQQYLVEDEPVPSLEPKFAYRVNALSAFKNPNSKPQTPEIITKDKVITRDRNLSVCGNSLPSIFSSSNSYVSRQDVNILELESPNISPSPRSKHRSIDSGWESMNHSMELTERVISSNNSGEMIDEYSLDSHENESSFGNTEVRIDNVTHLPDINSSSNFGEENMNFNQNVDEKPSHLPPITRSGNILRGSAQKFGSPLDTNHSSMFDNELLGEWNTTEHSDYQSNGDEHLDTVDQTNDPLPTINGESTDFRDSRNNEITLKDISSRANSPQTTLENVDVIDYIEEDATSITGHEDSAQGDDNFLSTLPTGVKTQSEVSKGLYTTVDAL